MRSILGELNRDLDRNLAIRQFGKPKLPRDEVKPKNWREAATMIAKLQTGKLK